MEDLYRKVVLTDEEIATKYPDYWIEDSEEDRVFLDSEDFSPFWLDREQYIKI